MKISRKLKVIIAVFAIIIVIIVVLIVLFGLGSIGPPSEPLVGLNSPSKPEGPGMWLVEVRGPSVVHSLSSYEVVLMKNGSLAVIAESLDAVGSTCSGSPGLSFVDAQGDGKLNGGDFFIVCGTDSVSEYQVQIFWKPTGNKVSGNTGNIFQN